MKKLIYILISLIISLIVFNAIQTNRVYIKAFVKKDCTVSLSYKNLQNKERTIYTRVHKYSDEGIQKIKFRLHDNIKSMVIEEKTNSLDIANINIISGFIPYKIKGFNISDNTFINIFIIRAIISLFIGFIIPIILWFFVKYIYTRKEKFMVGIFIFIFCLPILTMALPLEKIELFSLVGEKVVYYFPKFTLKTYADKTFQRNFEKALNQKLKFNTLYIKFFNTVYYTLFDKSYSSNSSIIIGKDKYLYEKGYINIMLFPNRYAGQNNVTSLKDIKNNIENLSEDLKLIQDYFEKQGKIFVFVITPSKADFEEDKIPDRFEINDVTYQEFLHNVLINSLVYHNIKFADSPTYIKTYGNKPVFAKGGIHLNDYGKILSTDALLKEISKTKKYNFPSLTIEKTYENTFPRNEDKDLISVLNLLYMPKNKFSVENIILKPQNNPAPNIDVKVIGGSFMSGICDKLTESHTFKNIDYYFYINKKIILYRDYLRTDVIEDETASDIEQNIKNAIDTDIFILELNDSLIDKRDGHVDAFIKEMKKIMAEDKK